MRKFKAMFTTKPDKVENNPLRQLLAERGHSTRSAAQVLGISYQRMSHLLAAHDEPEKLHQRIAKLPPRKPVKMRARISTRKNKKATAA
jgi:hypothetical protein